MNIRIQYEEIANEKMQIDARAMVGRLREKVEPLKDVIEQQQVQLTLYVLEAGSCRLIIDGSPEIQKEISDLVGAPESWS